MQRPRHEHASSSSDALRHQHGFRRCCRSIPHRSIRDLLSGQLAHQRLKLENRLKRALRDLGLIGSVRSEEFAALNDRVGHYRAEMVVNARTKKARIAKRILRRSLFE